MKIICPYCSTPFNDTLDNCPSCGAPNTGVRRRSGSQPITIDELKDWYSSRGLPPYETTRFFIGEDYRKPRAFGIYKDEKSGNFIVYKNKDDGQRTVRYEGTDEAYAVNELYQRLKQEIIQQKRSAIGRKSQPKKRRRKLSANKGCLISLILVVGLPIFFVLLGLISLLLQDPPNDGYYLYEQTLYCQYDHYQPDGCSDWFYYDKADGWQGPQLKENVPELLRKNRNAANYYLSDALPATRSEPSFYDSICFRDAMSGYSSNEGYYQHGEKTYYHLYRDLYTGWYYYDHEYGDWYESDYEDIPYELQHVKTSEDFYYTPTWDSSTQITDFTDTVIYSDYIEEQRRQEEEESSNWDDDYDDDYSWDSGDSWDSGSSDWDSDW